MLRLAVVGKERVKDWAQNTAPWHASVQGEDGGVMVVDPNRLWSVSEKVQDPVTKGRADAKISELRD